MLTLICTAIGNIQNMDSERDLKWFYPETVKKKKMQTSKQPWFVTVINCLDDKHPKGYSI